MHPLTTLTIAFLRLGTLVILLIFQAAGLSYARDYSSLIVKPSEPRLGGEWSGVQYWSAGEQKRNKAFELH